MPGSVFSTNLAIAIRAPVLPAETAAAASPSFTALIARRMLELRPWRSAIEGLASPATASGVWRSVVTVAQPLVPAQQGLDARQIAEHEEGQVGVTGQRPRGAVDDDFRRRIAAHRVQAYGEAHRYVVNGAAALQARRTARWLRPAGWPRSPPDSGRPRASVGRDRAPATAPLPGSRRDRADSR